MSKSILDSLLNAHSGLSAQMHGEMYMRKNISASNCYEQGMQFVESAIHSLFMAEANVQRQEGKEAAKKELSKP